MKKLSIISIAVLVIAGIIFFSCSDNQDLVDQTKEEQENPVSLLKSELSEFNSSYFAQLPETRKPKRKWWQWLIFGAGDCLGYVLGGVGGATGASTLIWTVTKPETIATSPSLGTGSVIGGSAIYDSSLSLKYITDPSWAVTEADKAGLYHNITISNLYKRHGDAFFELSINEMMTLVNKELVAVSNGYFTINALEKERGTSIRVAELCCAAIEGVNSVDEYLDRMKAYAPDLMTKEIIDILKVVFEGFDEVDIEEDQGQYINSIMKIVDKSNIPLRQKQELKSAVSVGHASTRLWNVDLAVPADFK